VPEWQLLPSRNYAAAYWGGTQPTIKASFSVYPSTASVAIQPRSEKCPIAGSMPSCFPPMNGQIITGEASDVEFTFVNALPNRIYPIKDSLLWQTLTSENGNVIKRIRLQTGPHNIYVLDPNRPPVDLMEHPLAEVLRYSTYLVGADFYTGMSNSDLLEALRRNLYNNTWKDDPAFGNINYISYDAGEHKYIYFFGLSSFNFHIYPFLDDLQQSQIHHITADCWSLASFYKSLANSLGVNADILEFSGSLDTVPIWPIGQSTFVNTVHWSTHATAVYPDYNGYIYEPTFELYYDSQRHGLSDVDSYSYKSTVFNPPIDQIEDNPQTIYLDHPLE
jgi:hypothetical protein